MYAFGVYICSINNATTFHQFDLPCYALVRCLPCFFKHTAIKILCKYSINIYDITPVDFNVNLKRTHCTTSRPTEWYIFLLSSVKICYIYEFYHNLNNDIRLERDIFSVRLIIKLRECLGTLTTWKTSSEISKHMEACSTRWKF